MVILNFVYDVHNYLGVYDPYHVLDTTPNYIKYCTKYNPLACAVGDLTRKQVCNLTICFLSVGSEAEK